MRKRMKIKRYNWSKSEGFDGAVCRGARAVYRCSYSRMTVAVRQRECKWRDLQNNGFCGERG